MHCSFHAAPYLIHTTPSCPQELEPHAFPNLVRQGGNAPPLTAVDPVTGVSVTFPNLNAPFFWRPDVSNQLDYAGALPISKPQTPTMLNHCPTKTTGIAMGVVKFLTSMGLFIAQSPTFFEFLQDLSEDADAARRGL
jgi:hypothetical protein